MFRIAICDDDKIIGSNIENILLKYTKRACIEVNISVFYSGEELYRYIDSGHGFDLIYLDIEMDSMNGLEVGKNIRNTLKDHKTEIVYISAKDEYDRQLFAIQPLHFIPKPIDTHMLIETLKLAMLRADKFGGIFTYRKKAETYKIPIKDIIYFESINREIRIIANNVEDTFYGTIQEVIDEVAKYEFIRIHRSYVVNYLHISRFKYDEVIMSNGIGLPISQSRRKEVREIQLSIEQEE